MATSRRALAPPDRPSLDTTITTPTGRITVADRITELLRVGTHIDHAAASVGVTVAEVRRWMRTGISVLSQLEAGGRWTAHTRAEKLAAVFADQAMRAEGEWIARSNAALDSLARGITTTKTRRKLNAQGIVIETTEETERQAPDVRVLTWRFERRYPNVYGLRAVVDVLGADSSDEPDTVDRLRDRLLQVGARIAAPPIDATATDEP